MLLRWESSLRQPLKNDQSLNEVRNSETNNRKEEKMGESKIRRREKIRQNAV